MRKVLVRPMIVWVVFLFPILQLSCAHKEPLPPSSEVRKNLGTIVVVSGCFKPKCSLQKRSTSRNKLASGAAKGAGEGALEVLSASSTGGEFGFCLGLALAPFGACIGCLVGAEKSGSTQKLDAESESALRNAFEQVNFQEITRDRILRTAREKTSYTFVSLGERGPSTPGEEFDYCSLANKGVDTVLEIAVLEAGLVGSGEIYPDLQVFVSSRTRLIRAVDGEELYAAKVTYKGAMQWYSAWAEENGQRFREELNNGCERLSNRVVELLFALPSTGVAVGIVDGDTITFLTPEEKVSISLYGIQCPGDGQAFAKEAQQFTAHLVYGKSVELEAVETDSSVRTAGLVTFDGVLLNEELLKAGYAWVDTRYCDMPVCESWKELEQEARKNKRGLWAEPNPVPPWELRKK